MKHIGTASMRKSLHTCSLCLHRSRVPQFAWKYPCNPPPPPGDRHLATVSPPHPGDRRALTREFARGGKGSLNCCWNCVFRIQFGVGKMQKMTEICQCLRRWHSNIFIGHTFAIQGVRALSCTCFQKEYIFYGALGLGVYGCTCACGAPQAVSSQIHFAKGALFGRSTANKLLT